MSKVPEDWGNPEEREITGVTLEQIERLCQNAFELRDHIQKEEARLNDKKVALRDIQEQIMHCLNDNGKGSYRSNYGNVAVIKKLSVKCPKDPESRKAFFDYLEEKGIFKDLVTVHSQTLNAFYKAEWDAAVMNGVLEFKMPGIGEPTYYENLQLRKG